MTYTEECKITLREVSVEVQTLEVPSFDMKTLKKIKDINLIIKFVKPRQVTSDLVTLFAQANAINTHFQDCVKKWSDGIEGADPAKCVPVKKHSRAIEKLYRSYSGDASRLIDLVRSSITFETMDALIKAVEKIGSDPKVAVLNYKNGFSEDFEVRDSAGYRNVALSLIVVDKFTTKLCCNLHICELQLGLKAIEDKRNAGGHKKYVEWRNLRAE